MSSRSVGVTSEFDDKLPRWLSPYVVAMEWFKETGLWEEVWERLKVNRQGYQGADLAMVLLAHRLTQREWGLKRFLEETAPYGQQLAAVAGRKQWPTQSAVSRALQAVDLEEVGVFADWVFEQTAHHGAFLLSHPGAYYRDGDGHKRRVMHADGTVEAMRQRALPEGDGLPEPKRFAANLGAAGYAGRKRGEVQYKVTLMQEAGTSLWVGAKWAKGNGHFSEEVEALTETADRWVQLMDESDRPTTVVTDGDEGGVGQAVAGAKSELGFATRLSCYDLLAHKEVVEHLNGAKWGAVQDSKSGPQRWATDAGTIRLRDVRVRVVVSRYRAEQAEGNGSGVEIEGWHYELYGFEPKSIEAVTAPDAVALYYGRNAVENRFGQRQREFNSPEVVSFDPGGQYLGIVMALLAWNIETILGAKAQQPLQKVADPPASEPSSRPVDRQLEPMPRPDPEALPESVSKTACAVSLETILKLLNDYDWEGRLDGGWTYRCQDNAIECPRGEVLTYQGARRVTEDRIEVRYFNTYSACSECPLRQGCSRSQKERFRREITVRLAVDPQDHPAPTSRFEWEPPSLSRPPGSDSADESTSPRLDQPAESGLRPPQLVPTVFRRRFRKLATAATTKVTINPKDSGPSLEAYLAADAAERQRRRATWKNRHDWNKLEAEADVELTVQSQRSAEQLTGLFDNDAPPDVTPASPG